MEPTLAHPMVVAGGTVLVDHSLTLNARAWAAGLGVSHVGSKTVTLTPPAPSMAPGTGIYTTPTDVVVSSSTPDVTIRYTTDGTTPTDGSAAVPSTGIVTIDRSSTLRTKAWKVGWEPGTAGSATYTMKVANPVFDPPAGHFSQATNVTLTSTTPDATMHYTTDGSSPTLASLSVPSGGTVLLDRMTSLRALGARPGWTSSAITAAPYIVTADSDNDGLQNWEETLAGTDPNDPDTNDDGLPDGAAVRAGVSATSPDVDGDGVANALELARGTNPFRPDSDDDSVNDAADCFPLDPTRAQCPTPDPNDQTPPAIILTEPAGAVLISSVP